MPIYNVNGHPVVFVHIPKTGGTSVEQVLDPYLTGFLNRQRMQTLFSPCSPQHYHYEILKNVLTLDAFACRFAVVRHPVDRLVSEYKFRRRFFELTQAFDDWVPETLRETARAPYHLDNHIRPQVEFIGDGIEVFALEQGLDDVWRRIEAVTGISLEVGAARREMASGGQRPDVSPAIRDMIAGFYRDDFEAFGYDLHG